MNRVQGRRGRERRGDGWIKGWSWYSERRTGRERRCGFDRRQRVAQAYMA